MNRTRNCILDISTRFIPLDLPVRLVFHFYSFRQFKKCFLMLSFWKEITVFVLSNIWMIGYFVLGLIRVIECPAGLESPAGDRNWRKANNCKNTKKPATSDSSFDPILFLECANNEEISLLFSNIHLVRIL